MSLPDMVVWAARPVKQYFGDNTNKLWMIVQILQHRDQSCGTGVVLFFLPYISVP